MAFTGRIDKPLSSINNPLEKTLRVSNVKEFSTVKSGLMDSFIRASQQESLVDEIKSKKSRIYQCLKANIEGFDKEELKALTEVLYDEIFQEGK